MTVCVDDFGEYEWQLCDACGGTGRNATLSGRIVRCDECNGRGDVKVYHKSCAFEAGTVDDIRECGCSECNDAIDLGNWLGDQS